MSDTPSRSRPQEWTTDVNVAAECPHFHHQPQTELGMQVAWPRGSIGVQGEAHSLQHPVRNVLRGEEVGFKHQANSHGVPPRGGGVDRRPEGVLQRRGK